MTSTLDHILNKENHIKRYLYFFEFIKDIINPKNQFSMQNTNFI